MDANQRLNITTAAVMAAGPITNYTVPTQVTGTDGTVQTVQVADPAAWEAAIHENAINIALMAGDDGLVGKALTGIDTTREDVKVFSGVIVSVRKEQSSTRGVITLHTGTDREVKDAISKQNLPAGCEQVRTERTDNPIGKALAIKARGLIGHRVLVYVQVEAIKGGSTKVRMLRHVVDLATDGSQNHIIEQMNAA